MQRGEVWWVNFDPSIGGEVKKTRPAIIVSNNMANRALNRLQVVPLSSQVKKLYPCEAAVKICGEDSKAMADQLTTVSKKRFREKIGQLSVQDMLAVEQVICFQLGITATY